MPIRSSLAGSAPAASSRAPSFEPRLVQARVSGTVWLLTAPKSGVVVHVGPRAQRSKGQTVDCHVGYTSNKLAEAKLAPFSGSLTLAA